MKMSTSEAFEFRKQYDEMKEAGYNEDAIADAMIGGIGLINKRKLRRKYLETTSIIRKDYANAVTGV